MDMEELLKKQKEFEDAQGARKALLGSLEAVANVPTAYEIRKGRTIGQPFKFTGGESPSSPLELAQAELAGQAKLADLEEVKQKQAAMASAADPQSKLAQCLRLFYKVKGIDVPDGLGAGEMARNYGTPKEILENESRLSKEQQLIADRAEAQKGLIQARALAAPKKASGGSGEFSSKDLLRQENAIGAGVLSDPITKETKIIGQSFNKIKDAYENPSPVGDISMVYNLIKMWDPGSVVREGEIDILKAANGPAKALVGTWQNLQGGGKLTPEVRKQMYDSALSTTGKQLDVYEANSGFYRDRAKAVGIKPEMVVPDLRTTILGAPKPQAQAPSRVPDQAALQAELKRRGLIK